jgi:hypothetical protein
MTNKLNIIIILIFDRSFDLIKETTPTAISSLPAIHILSSITNRTLLYSVYSREINP